MEYVNKKESATNTMQAQELEGEIKSMQESD